MYVSSTCMQNFIKLHQWKVWQMPTFICKTLRSIYSTSLFYMYCIFLMTEFAITPSKIVLDI